jgi:phytoene synthase
MASSVSTLSYCGREVRRYDNDRFLACLFAPAGRREALFAVFAFNLEVAKTREVVTQPVLGQMRLQWWRDVVEAVYGGGPLPAHEVAGPVAAAINDHALSRGHFDRLIDAREADLDDEGPATLSCLERYAEVTAAPLAALSLEALGVRDDAATRAGHHAAVAFALAGLLRAVPHHARQGRVMLPADRLAAHGLAHGEVLALRSSPALAAVAADIAALAAGHVERARDLRRQVPRAALPALLPATLAATHLAALRRAGHDVLAPAVQLPSPHRHLGLLWAMVRGRY